MSNLDCLHSVLSPHVHSVTVKETVTFASSLAPDVKGLQSTRPNHFCLHFSLLLLPCVEKEDVDLVTVAAVLIDLLEYL